MANIKISELTALTPPAASDELPVVDVSATSTKKTTVGEVVGIINGDVEVANDGTATISELPVSKLQDGAARQLLQTDAAGTGVEWTSNIDVPGTLDVTGAATLDSTLTVPLGSAAAPTLRFTGDPNTGLWSPSADAIAVSTGGSERLRLDSSGRLGLGTSSPNYQLHVTTDFAVGASGLNQQLTFSNDTIQSLLLGTGYTPLKLNPLGGNVGIGTGTSTPGGTLEVKAATSVAPFVASGPSSEFARIDSSGRLLVGTSSGQGNSLLQVQGDASSASAEGVLYLRRGLATAAIGANVGSDLGRIQFGANDGTVAANIRCISDGTWSSTSDTPGALTFSTTADGASSPTERMKIQANGQVLLNRTTSATGSILEVDASSNVAQFHHTGSGDTIGIYMRHGRGLSGFSGKMITFRRNDDTEVGSVIIDASSVAYNTSSDYRLKENVVPLIGAADRVNQLQVHRFNFIADPDKTVDGFIAHEAQAVVPECVTGEKDAVDEEGNPVYQGIDQSKLVPLLTAALQEAIGRIETLEAEVAALKAS